MKVILQDITAIQTGAFAKTVSTGTAFYLQVKDFDENGNINTEISPSISFDNNLKKYILRKGDILFAAKGSKNFAALYKGERQPAVASSSFFVIRLNSKYQDQILSEFLVWFINDSSALTFLKDRAIGTSILSISKAVLENLEVPVPSLEAQRIILELAQLRNRKKILQEEIEVLKNKIIQEKIANVLK